MALMRETVGTLRTYLLLVGILGGLSNLAGIFGPDQPAWLRLTNVPALVISALYLYLGMTLEPSLRQRPAFVKAVFLIAMAIQLLYVTLQIGVAVASGVTPIPISVIGFLITLYLYVQSRRLIREHGAIVTAE